jgi:hypothetical protein
MARRLGVTGVDPRTQVLPVIGSKELIMLLPTLLGVGRGDTVLIPELAYPTYEAGAALARATTVPCDDVASYDASAVRIVYLNSPRNPTICRDRAMIPSAPRSCVNSCRKMTLLRCAVNASPNNKSVFPPPPAPP